MFYKFTPPRHLTLSIQAKPGARQTKLVSTTPTQLHIMLSARPVDNAANQALVEFLAESFQCRRSDVHVVSGATGRDKVVRMEMKKDYSEEEMSMFVEKVLEEMKDG